jgi:hypothetical protein
MNANIQPEIATIGWPGGAGRPGREVTPCGFIGRK